MVKNLQTDPDDDDIAYQFDWGDGNLSSWSSHTPSGNSVTQNHTYSSIGTYEVRVKAKDTKDKESEWSTGLQVEIIEAQNAPLTPQAPLGPSNGYVDSTYSFQALTTDPEEDSIAYQFDWGDGTYSAWSEYLPSGDTVSMDHSYSSEGTYGIKSKAKDIEENESGWSSVHSITITMLILNSAPNTPSELLGPDSVYVDYTYNFSTSTTDTNGDNISYQFDWGDGTYSGWSEYVSSGNSVNMEHSYSSEGTYNIRSKAKDEDEAESAWSNENSIVASYIAPGDTLWSFSDPWNVASSPAIGSDGTIYVGSHDYNLYAINPDGTEKWAFSTLNSVGSSPVIGSDGTIYVGSDSYLYAINPDGTEKWALSTGDMVTSSPAIGSDGTIYVGSYGGKLYAIYGTSGGLANTAWPMFHHDLKHTGRDKE